MMKHIVRFGLIIIVIAILVVTGINRVTDDTAKRSVNSSAHTSELQPLKRVPSKYDGINLYIKTEKTNTYKIETLTPVTKSDTINEAIEEWIETEKQAFIANTPEDSKKQATFNLTVKIERESKDYDRFIFKIKKKSNGEETEQEKVFNVDLDAERMLLLDDFININDHTLQTLLNQSLELLEQNEGIIIDENSKIDIRASQDNWEWFINKKGLSFIFDGNAITEDINSSIHANIPFQELYLLLHDDVDKYIKLTNIQKAELEKAIQKEKKRILEAEQRQEKREQEKVEAKRKQQQSVSKTNPKYVALTFDDGPSGEVTPRVLDILKQYNAKATFFMVGTQVDSYPKIARQVADAGHEIGNHTERHQDLKTLGPAGIRKEIGSTSDKIYHATGIRPYLVRPPYGAYNDNVINDATNNSNSIILWSVDSLDWQSRNATSINREIQQAITSGSIVLMHDIHSTTADALPELMKNLHQEGYQFVTVSQLLKIQERDGAGPFYGHYK